MMSKKPNVVTIGGGTGMPAVLSSLKYEDVDLSAIVTVGDDGGSSGVLRRRLQVVPAGDIRNSIAALSTLPKLDLEIFQARFGKQDDFLAKHSIGNLILAAMEKKDHGIFPAVQDVAKAMKTRGKVYPACNGMITLYAKFTDGTTQKGESEITYTGKDIQRLWVRDDHGHQPQAVPEAIQAIKKADLIVLGPGSLYTSVMPNLMIPNLQQAVLESSAPVVYICNVLTQKGETMHYTDADHVKALDRQVGKRFVNYAIVNNAPVPKGAVDYRQHHEYSIQVKNDPAGFKPLACRAITGDFLQLSNHNANDNMKKVAKIVSRLAIQSMKNVK